MVTLSPSSATKRKRGGQPGNQNARRHGFYSDVLDKRDRQALVLVAGKDGLDDEIDLLRVRLRAIMQNSPNNVRLAVDVSNTITKMVRTRDKLTAFNRNNQWKVGIANVWREFALPLLGPELGQEILREKVKEADEYEAMTSFVPRKNNNRNKNKSGL